MLTIHQNIWGGGNNIGKLNNFFLCLKIGSENSIASFVDYKCEYKKHSTKIPKSI